MKKLLGPLVRRIVRTPVLWFFCKYILRFAEWLRYERSSYDHKIADQRLKNLFPSLVIKDGYFKGLQYPGFVSFGSSLFPKLSGNYESELFETFHAFEDREYETIIDIGCAEGYYAVGMAQKFPKANVLAFDIDERARILCRQMAVQNGVSERITILEACTPEKLKELNAGSCNLLICDCEGFERHLFNKENIHSLSGTDLVIELHPFYERDVKEYLSNLFCISHQITVVSSLDNNRKMFDLPTEYMQLSYIEKIKLVEEGRPFSMEWMTMTPKNP